MAEALQRPHSDCETRLWVMFRGPEGRQEIGGYPPHPSGDQERPVETEAQGNARVVVRGEVARRHRLA